MNETYVECLVKRRPSVLLMVLKVFLIVVTVLSGVLALAGFYPAFFLAVLCGVVAYVLHLFNQKEFEYLYIDRTVSVDRILGGMRRKKIAEYELSKVEIMAPVTSYRVAEYIKRSMDEKDYSIGYAAQPDERYLMIYEGKTRIIFSPNADMIRIMHQIAPQKVFTE